MTDSLVSCEGPESRAGHKKCLPHCKFKASKLENDMLFFSMSNFKGKGLVIALSILSSLV